MSNPKMKNKYNKNDTLETRIRKMTGQRDARDRWGYRKETNLTNAGIIALLHIKKLTPILAVKQAEIRKLKALRQMKREMKKQQ